METNGWTKTKQRQVFKMIIRDNQSVMLSTHSVKVHTCGLLPSNSSNKCCICEGAVVFELVHDTKK